MPISVFYSLRISSTRFSPFGKRPGSFLHRCSGIYLYFHIIPRLLLFCNSLCAIFWWGFFLKQKTGDAFLAENISCDKAYVAVEVCCIFAYCVLLFQQAPKRFAAFHGFRHFRFSAHSRAKKLWSVLKSSQVVLIISACWTGERGGQPSSRTHLTLIPKDQYSCGFSGFPLSVNP